jgi:hypothetical protein
MDEYAHGQIRATTHHDIAAEDIDAVVRAVRTALDDTAGSAPAGAPRRIDEPIAVGRPQAI